MTKTQNAALAKLRAMRDAGQLVPQMTRGEMMIRTGINTTVLARLKQKGLISCRSVYLNGNTTPDLVIS